MKRQLWAVLAVLCLLTGCTPSAQETESTVPETAPVADAPAYTVYTDWSKLTPYETAEPLYSYFEPYSGSGPLQPRDDYGPLLPYIGACSGTSSYMGDLPRFGLVTTDGRLVTDPVYAAIGTVASYWPEQTQMLPFLVLQRGQVRGRIQEDWGVRLDGGFDYIITDLYGRWVREFTDNYEYFLLDPTHLVIVRQDGSLTVIDDSGQTTAFFPTSALEPYLGEGFQWWDFDGGPGPRRSGDFICIWQYDEAAEDFVVYCWLDPATGAVTAEPPAGFTEQEEAYHYLPSASFKGYGAMDAIMDPITGDLYYYGRRTDGSDIADLLDADGQVLLADCRCSGRYSPWVWGGRIACTEDEDFCWYDLDGNCVFRYPVRTNTD